PGLSSAQAVVAAASALHLSLIESPVVTVFQGGVAQKTTLQAPGASLDAVPANLLYAPDGHGVQLAWDLVLRTPDGQHWYNDIVDASDGNLLKTYDWVDHAEYQVFALPVESPSHGSRTIVVNPQDATAS